MLLKDQMAIIHKHQTSAPVKVVQLANSLGLDVYRIDTWENKISGMLKKDGRSDSGYAIFVNGTHPTVRRRFTIAHEIGHFILHENLLRDGIVEDALLRAEGLSNKTEAQANEMAADILMPWNLIGDLQQRGVTSIEDLASSLNVSNDAMSIRLLGVSYDCACKMGAGIP